MLNNVYEFEKIQSDCQIKKLNMEITTTNTLTANITIHLYSTLS